MSDNIFKRIKLCDLIENRKQRKICAEALKAIDSFAATKYQPGLFGLFLARILNDNSGIGRIENKDKNSKKFLYVVSVANLIKFPFSLDFEIKDEGWAWDNIERVLTIVNCFKSLKSDQCAPWRIGDLLDYDSDIDIEEVIKEPKKKYNSVTEVINDFEEEIRRSITGFKLLTEFFFTGDRDLANERCFIFRNLSQTYLRLQRQLDWYSNSDYKLDEYNDILNKKIVDVINDTLIQLQAECRKNKENQNMLLLYMELSELIKQHKIKAGNYFLFLKIDDRS